MYKYIIGMPLKAFFLFLMMMLCGLTGYTKDRVDVVAENAPAVVAVNVLRTDGSTFTGTGFVVTPDGVIATARHALENAVVTNITFPTGVVSGQALPVLAHEEVDVALIRIAARDLDTVQLADSDLVLPGQEITVIGNPRRLQNTVSSGLISQVRRQADGVLWHQISAPISPSSSGSPVFNEDGQVISMAVASYQGDGNQNLNFAVPSNYIIQMLQRAGYTPPESFGQCDADDAPRPLWQRFTGHVKLCWQSLCRLFSHQD